MIIVTLLSFLSVLAYFRKHILEGNIYDSVHLCLFHNDQPNFLGTLWSPKLLSEDCVEELVSRISNANKMDIFDFNHVDL